MDPSTGKILAMVSKPDFDPNTVSQNWNELSTSEDSVLLNRATQGQYAPGSTFKLVTTLEFMRENADFDSYSYNCTGSIESGDVTIHCYGGHVHGQVTLRDSLAYSCNTSFSNIGRSLNADTYKDTAQELLFNKKLPSVLPYSKSQFTLTSSDTEAERMMTAMGQGKTQVSPYHMALITSAIANGGTLMKPYLVDSVTNNAGNVIEKTKPEKYKDLMTSKEAAQLKDYMTAVTDYGTASVLGGQNYTAAGKTGTAEFEVVSDGLESAACSVEIKAFEADNLVPASTGSGYEQPELPSQYNINDSMAGSGLYQFNFQGTGWEYGTESTAYKGDNHWTNVAGDTCEIRFEGPNIQYYGAKAPAHGIAAFSIDGGEEVLVDCYSASRQGSVLLFDSGLLKDDGEHVLKVRVTGEKNASASGYYVNADRVVIDFDYTAPMIQIWEPANSKSIMQAESGILH